MDAAKAKGDKGMQRRLNKLLENLDYKKIAEKGGEMTSNFRAGLNNISASKKF